MDVAPGRRPVTAPVRTAIRVEGIVQGVGFRPFVYTLATGLGLSGFVGNDVDGVFVEVEGPSAAVTEFLRKLERDPPPLARIERVTATTVTPNGDTAFAIAASGPVTGSRRTLVSADTATCADCLRELADPDDRRYRYPFINCTNCGPRFTIVRDVPYDRPFTTMAPFAMCPPCAAEYHDPADRRFHAQPTCCPACGPRLTLRDRAGNPLPGDPLTHAAELLTTRPDPRGQGPGRLPPGRRRRLRKGRRRPARPQAPRGQAVRGARRRPGPGPRARRDRPGRRRTADQSRPPHRAAAAPPGRGRRPGRRPGEPLPRGHAALHPAAPPARPRPRPPHRADQRERLRRADRVPRRRRAGPAGPDRGRVPHPRPGHPHPDRRLGGPDLPRPADADPAVPRLRPRAGHRRRRVPPPGPGLRRRAEEHVLPGQGPARVRLAPHRRPGERRDAALLHRGHRALPPAVRHRPAGRGPRPAPGVPVHQVRARPRRRRPARRPAPPRAHRLVPGRQWRRRPGHRGRLRRHRLRDRRHDLGR